MAYCTVATNPNPSDAENPPHVADEEQPLLSPSPIPDADPDAWKPPKGFLWIEVAIFANVFLSGFDGTITASTYALISSEFNAANTSSWLTTSYLITSTAFQPLYGRFSDIFGRRACFFTSTVTFLLGCLGCAVAQNVIFLNLMRALTGIGGGGLMTMATIINSDMIPFQRRGMYQAAQNVLHGFGSICGASLGGSIANTIGWRWCFLLQVPVSIFALFVGRVVIPKRQKADTTNEPKTSVWKQVDLTGALLLILGLSVQLVGLSLGGNELPWGNAWVVGSLVGSVVLLGLFFLVEARTSAIPVIPLRMLHGVLPVSTQIANICVGMAAYAFLFNLPLFFQIVLLDSASKAGARLVIPSLATPIGGLLSGIIMSRYGKLSYLMRAGATLMFLGNLLVMALQFSDSEWKYFVYVIPANLGQGVVYPAILFTFLAAFGHDDHAVSASTVYLIRSLGTVYGVAITSTIVQNHLVRALPDALHGVPEKWKVIDSIRHSVSAIYDLEPEIQLAARHVYYQGIKMAFGASAAFGGVAALAAMFARGRGLKRAGES
ncbi:Putative Multidrug efflux transporter (Eurofung) [Aspergillus calidoustus]|uniref:Putative Multidrug efflux transporter (Eurofung) n=1 Tax=Aspergillus calidoustus TaxID=454130 RepID=A0A0U5GQL2_ASPCI|nr:Putative Multidrug efflux transporter (Eurofung) [Aspergillus calidoustus]